MCMSLTQNPNLFFEDGASESIDIPSDAAANASKRFENAGMKPKIKQFTVEVILQQNVGQESMILLSCDVQEFIKDGQPTSAQLASGEKSQLDWWRWKITTIVEGDYGMLCGLGLLPISPMESRECW